MTTDLCPGCGAVVAAGANFCGGCGKPLGPMAPAQTAAKPRWYYNVWFVLLTLFFVAGPFGLPLVWKNPRFSRGVKIALTLVMVVYTVALIQMTVQAVKTVTEHFNQLTPVF